MLTGPRYARHGGEPETGPSWLAAVEPLGRICRPAPNPATR